MCLSRKIDGSGSSVITHEEVCWLLCKARQVVNRISINVSNLVSIKVTPTEPLLMKKDRGRWRFPIYLITFIPNIGRITRRGRISRGSSTPPPLGDGGPSAPQYLGFPSISAYTLWTTKFDVVWGGDLFYGSATPLPQGGRSPARPNFWVRFHLWVHLFSQNYQFWRGNIWGAGLFLRSQPRPCRQGWGYSAAQFWMFPSIRSATPLHLHKCVARFVSDSWVCCFYNYCILKCFR